MRLNCRVEVRITAEPIGTVTADDNRHVAALNRHLECVARMFAGSIKESVQRMLVSDDAPRVMEAVNAEEPARGEASGIDILGEAVVQLKEDGL